MNGRHHAMTSQLGRRSGVSALTDAELTIIDIAAMGIARRGLYRDSIFLEQWNRPSHGLDDETLVRTLHRFETEGLITSEACYDQRGRPDRTVRLTAVGGSLWESERLPDWMRYVSDRYPKNRISIYGYSAGTCDRYFRVACDARLITCNGGRIRRAVADRQLVYWRPSQPVHLLSAPVTEGPLDMVCCIDWSYFESQRSWWRFPDEIATFWSKETG